MLETLTQIITDNGGPSHSTITAGADHVKDLIGIDGLEVVTEFDLAALMVGSVSELAGVGNLATELMQAFCRDVTIQTAAPLMGGTDTREIDGCNLDRIADLFPHSDLTTLQDLLETHFNSISSLKNLLASYPKMTALSVASINQSTTATVYFDCMSPAYTVPLSIVCNYEIGQGIGLPSQTLNALVFDPWDRAALKLHLIEPANQSPEQQTIH